MEVEIEKKKEAEIINNNGPTKMAKKPVKKKKQKETKNYKDLKDLLSDINENKKKKDKKHNTKKAKKKNIKKETLNINIKGQNSNEINNNKNIEKDIEDISDHTNNELSNNSKSNDSTTTSIISQEEIINDINKAKIEAEPAKTINTLSKNKRTNFILKKIENNNCDLNIINNENNNSKSPSLMCKYYEGYEKYLQKKNLSNINLYNSINFVEKQLISPEFNFNNDKFIIKNNLQLNDNNNNNLIFNTNKFNLNYMNHQYNNNNNNNFDNCPDSLNNNLFFTGIDMKNCVNDEYDENDPNIFGEGMINGNNSKNVEQNDNFNAVDDINKYILQNAFSFEKSEGQDEQYTSRILEDLNLNFNKNTINNMLNLYPSIFNNNNTNNGYKYNININNNYICNSDNTLNNKMNYNNSELYNFKKNSINNNHFKKNKFARRPNDWVCSKCFNLNFGFRVFCNRCSTPKGLSLCKQ